MLHSDMLTNTAVFIIGTPLIAIFEIFSKLFTTLISPDYLTIVYSSPIYQIWSTGDEYSANVINVLFVTLWTNSYWDSLKLLAQLSPNYVTFDYLHYHYAWQITYTIFIKYALAFQAGLMKPICIKLYTSVFFKWVFSKWSYLIYMFGLAYFFSNVVSVRYTYGFNMYINFFKSIGDLVEQEYGSYDDYQFFVFFLIQLFAWYCWLLVTSMLIFGTGVNYLIFVILVVISTILTIPVRLLWDFGLAFGMYVRGAASSSNLIVEAFFDIIGVIIIFTRFIVQNIRFLLVFAAYFELYEWSVITNNYSYLITYTSWDDVLSALTQNTNSWYVILVLVKSIFIYLYHLLHLIIVSFMQIGVFLMVSFWLFFFLYTSFFKITNETYFSIKRHN